MTKMNETTLNNVRIKLKGDTLENWGKAENFKPLDRETLLVRDKGNFFVGDGETTAKEMADNGKFYLPTNRGEGENSVVGNDLLGNQAVSAYSTALGEGTIAGSKGFRIIASEGTAGGAGTYTLEGYNYATSSANILPPPNKKTETITDSNEYGEGYSTYTLNDDGSFHLEWSTPVSLAHRIEFNGLNLEAGKSYVISQSGLDPQVSLSIEYNNASHYLNDYNNCLVFDVDESTNSIIIDLLIESLSFGDTNLYIWINDGTEAKEYDKYSQGDPNAYAIGDQYSLRISNIYDRQGYITGINGNVITVDNFVDEQLSTEFEYKIKGKWQFEKELGYSTMTNGESFTQSISFTSNKVAYSEMKLEYGNAPYLYYNSDFAYMTGWDNENLRIVDFGNDYQIVTKQFYDEFKNNATPIDGDIDDGLGDKNSFRVESKPLIGNIDIGKNSFAIGIETKALGYNSFAEGSGSIAFGKYSHAEGYKTEAYGAYSHAEGYNTMAASQNQHVQGRYNIEDTEGRYAHIVGNGNSSAPSNAHTLDWSGNAWFAGDVTVGENNDKLATAKYVSKAITDMNQAIDDTYAKKGTTLLDYGIVNAYDYIETDQRIDEKVSAALNGKLTKKIVAWGKPKRYAFETIAQAKIAGKWQWHEELPNTFEIQRAWLNFKVNDTQTCYGLHGETGTAWIYYYTSDVPDEYGEYDHYATYAGFDDDGDGKNEGWMGATPDILDFGSAQAVSAAFALNFAKYADPVDASGKITYEAIIPEENVIYMVKDENATGDMYREYMLIDGELVQIGDTSVDLMDYVKKVEGKDLSTNDFTDEDKANLDNLNNFNIKNGNGDRSVAQCDSVTNGSYGTAFGKSTTAGSEAGFTHGYKTLTAPCSKYIKNDLALTSADEHNFIIDYAGTDTDVTPAVISYRYWSLDQNKYLYFNEVVESFPYNVAVTDTIEGYSDAYQTFEFTPGKSDESAYLFENNGSVLNAATEGVWAVRFADGSNYFTYKYDLSNVEWRDDTTILWTATVSNHLKLEWSTDNSTWNILENSYDARLESKSRSYEIHIANENTLYIKISDASGNGFGGSVSKLYPVTLDVCGTAYYIDILFGGKLTTGEEMINTETAESLLAPTASGFATCAVGKGSYAGGYLTTAWKPAAFAHGYKAIALGDAATAFGGDVLVKNDRAFAAGMGLISAGHSQSVFGRYNQENDTDVMIVGWGESKSKPKNIFTVSKEGNGTFTGNINASGTVNANNANLSNDLTAKSITTTSLNATNILVDGNKVISANDVYLDERVRRNAFLLCSKIENDLGYVTKAVYGNNFGRWSYLGSTQTERIIVKLPVDNPVDITSTKKVGTWLYWGGVDGATVDVEFTSSTGSGKQGPDVEEVMFKITLKAGWNYYKLDFAHSNSSAEVASGCIGYWSITTNGNNKYAPDYSNLNYIRMHTTKVDGVESHSIDFAIGEIVTISNESTPDSITIGSTTITEEQLKKLLTLLDYTEYTGGTV